MRDLIDLLNRLRVTPHRPEPSPSRPVLRSYPIDAEVWPRPNPMPLSYRSGHRGATITEDGITLD